jgi:hypothetical protein
VDRNAAIAIAVIGLGLLLFFAFSRKSTPTETTVIKARPQGSLPREYTNEETWSIEWDKESGLPTKVVIHRNAREF